jgi:Flp pilus assembly protein TadD
MIERIRTLPSERGLSSPQQCPIPIAAASSSRPVGNPTSLRTGKSALRPRWQYQDASKKIVSICLLLSLITLACFWPMTSHQFITFDDPEYITENPHVTAGLTWSGLVWAFQSGYACNWHPLTWLSHMADCELYGLNAGGHLLTNLLLHTANTLLLFLLLNGLTRALWPSALTAALFAWHPLHVESVAWASERKDVLSTFFFLLALGAYARYAQEKGEGRKEKGGGAEEPMGEGRGEGDKSEIRNPKSETNPRSETRRPESEVQGSGFRVQGSRFPRNSVHSRSSVFYLLALLFFALALMSKPMVVTFPFVLLLLDFWPLGRVSGVRCRVSGVTASNPVSLGTRHSSLSLLRLVLEKLPFFAFALADSVVAYLVQSRGGAVSSLAAIPVPLRLENALVSYARYLGKTIWPVDLAAIYHYPQHLPASLVLAGGLVLAAVSAICVLRAQRQPYLIVGWLWFLGTLVPAIGLVQVGAQSMADRYMYIPSIGLFLLVVWAVNDFLRSARLPIMRRDGQTASAHDQESCAPVPLSAFAAGLAAAALVGCLLCTRLQLRYWEDGEQLFRHSINVTANNYVAYNHLAKALAVLGREQEAFAACAESVRLKPRYAEGRFQLGTLLMEQGRFEEAVSHFRVALEVYPEYAGAHNNLGNALLKLGRLDEARPHLSDAVRLDPNNAGSRYNFGTVLLQRAQFAGAVAQYEAAVRLKPDYAEAHRNLGVALMQLGRTREATLRFAEAARLEPDDPDMRFNFGLALLEHNLLVEAAAQFVEALRLRPDHPATHYRLGVALARQHKSREAIFHLEKACDLASASGQPAAAAEAQDWLNLFLSGRAP